MAENTLEIRNLNTSFFTQHGEVRAVNDVSLDVRRAQITGIVGESGCGKSMTARSVMGLVRYPGRIVSGRIRLDGKEITGLSKKEMCSLRGNELSMIFQEPMSSLNPVMKVGKQVEETLRIHQHVTKEEAARRTEEIFREVGISDARSRMACYPHQLSGGLRQRVMIAMAMICKPKLLIADEPTTALDVTVEAQILSLMKRLCEGGTSILLISHNLGVIAQVCDLTIRHTPIPGLFWGLRPRFEAVLSGWKRSPGVSRTFCTCRQAAASRPDAKSAPGSVRMRFRRCFRYPERGIWRGVIFANVPEE